MNNCYRTKWIRCAKISKAQSFNNGVAKLRGRVSEREREREIERAFCDGEENASLNNFFFLITLHWINWLQTHCLYIRLESGNKERITDYKNNFQLTRN